MPCIDGYSFVVIANGLILTLLTIILVIFLGGSSSYSILTRIDSFSWVAILLSVSLHFLIEPARWAIYLRNTSLSASYRSCFQILSSSALLSYLLPFKLGIPIRFFMFKKYQHLKSRIVTMYMTIDSTLVLLTWCSATLLLSGSWLMSMNIWAHWNLGLWLSFATAILAILITLLLLMNIKIRHLLTIAKETLSSIRRNQLLVAVTLLYVDIAFYALRHAAIFTALSISGLPWEVIIAISTLSIFAGFLTLLPMGLLGYDAAIILLLSQHGVEIEKAMLVPIVNRISTLLVSTTLGVYSTRLLKLEWNISKLISSLRKDDHGI